MTVAVNEVWLIEFGGSAKVTTGGNSTNIKFALVGPTGAIGEGEITGVGDGPAYKSIRITDAATFVGVFGDSVLGADGPINGYARITIDASHSGTIVLAARPTIDGKTITLEAGFFMRATKATAV